MKIKLIKENEEPKKFTPEVKKHFLEIVSTYNKYQESMDRKSDLAEIAETLGGITEAAKTLLLGESDDWFDKVTIKRNMNELEKLGKEFDKCAMEANSLDQRMNGLYEDMGHILSRYYKMGEISEDTMKQRLGIKESVNEGPAKTKKTISKQEWNKIPKYNKHIGQDGTKYIMQYSDSLGTYLQGVVVEGLNEAGEDINNAPIPGDVRIKLEKALAVLNGKKLTYPQKLQVMGRVLDSLGIDKKELNKVTQKIRTKLESTEDTIEEVSYDSQGNLKIKKQYKTLSDYENVAKKGDYIWVGNNPNSFKGAGKELLSKVLGKDSEGNVILTPFGRNKKYTIPQKNQLVVVVEGMIQEKNCPTDPGKWSASKSAAKKKFDVYPSAYANGWAAKNYKAKGGGWKKCD